MNKAFKRTKFNRYKWLSTITVSNCHSLRKNDLISIGDVCYAIVTKITGNVITIFNEGQK